MEFESIVFHILHNTDVNMLCRLFSDRKYMYICLPICQEYGYLAKQKISEDLWPSPCTIHSHTPVEDLSSTTTTSKHQRFTLNIQF